MTAPVTLLMAIHCHQPVGNFDFVFEDAYAKSYEPFLSVLERHPGVRLALHYSGPLLDWLINRQPAFLARVRRLAARGQIELLTSGYYEPILPLIPEADRQGQIAMMRQAIRARFGAEADGLWLTERVWEPELPQSLASAGIRYTMVDTNQFLPAKPWLPGALQVQDEAFWDVLGSYATDYAGSTVRLFPSSKRLRYIMPFKPAEQTIEFLKRLRREMPVAVTFADDGEKFGLWPKTHEWVYREGWLERFFTALEAESSWLSTTTFREYVETVRPDGHVWLPCGSYEEMLEWSNGHFRNFFTKYPEANAMQQAMLRVSEDLQRVEHPAPSTKHPASKRAGKRTDTKAIEHIRRHLYAAQCNCAYWHGVFGGLYLSHLRRAVYAHLASATAVINQLTRRRGIVAGDAAGDGVEAIRVVAPGMDLTVDPADGGTLTAWNLYAPAVNVLDTLSRRPEAYHRTLRALTESSMAVASSSQAPSTIHDALGAKEEQLGDHVVYDDHRRAALLDYAFQSLPTLQETVRSTWGERRLWPSGAWERVRSGVRRASGPWDVELTRAIGGGLLRKRIHVPAGRTAIDCRYRLEGVQAPVVALEFNFSLRDERRLQEPQQQQGVRQLELEEQWSGLRMSAAIDPPATVYTFPVETVSGSEGGMERTFQGLCVVCLWEPSAGRWEGRVSWTAAARHRPSTRRS